MTDAGVYGAGSYYIILFIILYPEGIPEWGRKKQSTAKMLGNGISVSKPWQRSKENALKGVQVQGWP